MKIDLREIPVYFINLESRKDRFEKTKTLLQRLGFKFINQIVAETHINPVIGCALSHIKALDLIKEDRFLLVEDDIDFADEHYATENRFEIEVEDCDALYIGTSYRANEISRSRASLMCNSTQKTNISDRLYKISYMTGLHAVLYMTDSYRMACKYAIIEYLGNKNGNLHCDVAIAEIQKDWNVVALDKPIFYQLDPNNPANKFWTLKPLYEFE